MELLKLELELLQKFLLFFAANCVGVIDPDYRGEIIVALHNDTDEIQTIKPKDRIGQAVIMPRYKINWEETDKLDDTKRGDGGFGSTG